MFVSAHKLWLLAALFVLALPSSKAHAESDRFEVVWRADTQEPRVIGAEVGYLEDSSTTLSLDDIQRRHADFTPH